MNPWEKKGAQIMFVGAAAAHPETMRSVPEPDDFDAFWAKRRSTLAAVPMKADLKEHPSDSPSTKVYSFSIACAGPRPVTGTLTVPTKPGKYPAEITFHGYSKDFVQTPPKHGHTDRLFMFINAHGYELGREPEYYKAFYESVKSNGHTYGTDPVQNADPDKAYFSGMTYRIMRALEYLKSRPEWDGKNLTATGGSMGGLQSIWAGALDPDVTKVSALVPWCCDMGGRVTLHRFYPGSPKETVALRYFDPVNLAKRIPKTTWVDIPRAGLGDESSPPNGVSVLWNNLGCRKSIRWVQGSTHGEEPPKEFREEYVFREGPRNGSDETLPQESPDGRNVPSFTSDAKTVVMSLNPTVLRLGDAEVGFRMHLGRPGDAGTDVSNAEMTSFLLRQEGAMTVGVWRGHPVLGTNFAVTATFESQGKGWLYSFSWSGLESRERMVESVSFPELTVPRSDTSGVLYSRAHGMGMVRRPDWNAWAKTPEEPLVSPMREFQFAALLDDRLPCWYLDARDGEARLKYTYASCGKGSDRRTATIGIRTPLPLTREMSVRCELPWRGLITPFAGGWWDAAQIYKPWALRQEWAKKARLRMKSARFARLRDICFWAWNRGNASQVVPPFERFMVDSGVSCALDWYWWHHQSYDTGYPNFWPPRDGEAAFASAVGRLRRKGAYTMVYTNGMSRDMDDESWGFGEGGEKDARVGHDGRIFSQTWNVHMPTPHRLAAMCGEGRGFQQLLGDVISHLSDVGLDAVYLDQVSCGTGKPCWNPRHAHLPGDALGDTRGYYRFLKELRTAHPHLALASEEVTEAYLGEFDFFISLFGTCFERCRLGTGPECEALPVWQALYHGLVPVFGTYSLMDGIPAWDDEFWPAKNKWTREQEKDWPALFPDQFAVEFCRTVVWGNQPSAHTMRLEHAESPKYAADYRFMVDTARFYAANRPHLFDGELLDPGRMTCATKRVDFASRRIYNPAGAYEVFVQPALPTVLHNVWRAPDGQVAAIMVNWTREPQSYRLETPDKCVSGVLAPRSWLKR